MTSEKIRKRRNDFNISQVTLAKELGVTKQRVSNWENDNILPSVEMLIKIAKYFNVSTDYLLDITPDNYVDVTGLNSIQIAHLKLIINDLKKS